MPIESAIIKQNKLNRKTMPVTEFRSACHEFAQHYVDVQSEGFQRLGALGDWDHPYLTMNPSFEAEEVKVFGAMYKRGLHLQGPQARLLVPPRRDRPGRGGDRVPGRPLHHRLSSSSPSTTTWASWGTLTRASSSSSSGPPPSGPCRGTWPSPCTPTRPMPWSRPPTGRSTSWPRPSPRR